MNVSKRSRIITSMKSFTTSALILILITLLLVLVGGFVFLFQAEVRLRDQVHNTAAEVTALQQEQATASAEMAAVAATRDAAVVAVATAEYGAVLLEGQLVDSQQDNEQLTAEMDDLSTELEEVQAELTTLQTDSGLPEVQLLSPEDDDTLNISTDIEIVVIAGDAAGLASITIAVDDDDLSTFSLSGERLATRSATWETPDEEGLHTITVSASSINSTESEPLEIEVNVVDVEARNTAIRADVEAAVIDLRGLPLLEPVTPTILTRDELRDRIAADAAEDESPEESRQDVLALSAFDFLPRDYDLAGELVDLTSEGILGFYDPETAEFVVVSDGVLLDPSAQWTHAHEFVHALQDQHYSLDGLTDEATDSESRAAIRALAEGEADLVQYLFLYENDFFSQKEVADILNSPEQNDSSFLDDVPPILVSNLAFPYREGLEFVAALYREGGFEAIDAAWQNPPRSTEHIMHPERYLDQDAPQLVALSPLTTTLGIGWELIDEDILGEFFLREYLDQQLAITAAERAATGWGGDRYAVYWNDEAAELVMALHLVWDTPADAVEFGEAFALYAANLLEAEAQDQADGSVCWEAGETMCLSQTAAGSFVVRAPSLEMAGDVLAALQPAVTNQARPDRQTSS